jgi:hypothetical protein
VILNELGASFEGVLERFQEIVPRDNSLWPTLRCLQFGQTKSVRANEIIDRDKD